MGLWISVNDTNSHAPVTDAFFSESYFNSGNGNYYLYISQNQVFWVDSPEYRVQYANSDGYSQMQVSLTRDVWP